MSLQNPPGWVAPPSGWQWIAEWSYYEHTKGIVSYDPIKGSWTAVQDPGDGIHYPVGNPEEGFQEVIHGT